MRIIASFFAAFAVLFSAPTVAQDWYVAETQHFTIYSKDSKSKTEEFAREMERLDEVLRILSGVGPDDGSLPPSSKVTVFRYGQTKDMATLAGYPGSGIGGFFIPRATGSDAFVPRRQTISRERSNAGRMRGMALDPKAVLFHEYVHYFMFQHRNAPYPAWYREGFAELFSTLKFEDSRFVIGDAPSWRSVSINAVPIDLELMFDPPERVPAYTARVYGHGWLLASLLNFTPERRSQIGPYLAELAKGTNGMEAARMAFGDLDQLKRELDEYKTSSAKVLKVPYMNEDEPEVAIRKLSEAEEARMEPYIQIRAQGEYDQRSAERMDEIAARYLDDVRELVQRYPDQPSVLTTAAEIELHNKNYERVEELSKRALDLDPDSTKAAIFYAQAPMMASLEDPSKLIEARARFAAANRMENDHPVPLYNYYLTFALSGEDVPDDAKAALESAYQFAPFDDDIRVALAHMFLLEDEDRIAKNLLQPLAISPHYPERVKLQKAMDKYEEGETEDLMEFVKPRHPAIDKDWSEEEEEEGDEN